MIEGTNRNEFVVDAFDHSKSADVLIVDRCPEIYSTIYNRCYRSRNS